MAAKLSGATFERHRPKREQVRIHESTVACDWAGAVMPENYEKSEVISDRPTDRQTDRHSEL